ncbi:MAG: hypothetical protein COV75_07655 [Candidatus Omnitrophica bacterium CG11_big_fil_rev_8_21_14_0_20_63_9]|nr:MAG: hypothetical protein COV75_07655 [Candidatus Omnitrophica bacterium CG11_big_fil_rev_8_21_14_0_20_63_9]
MAPPQVFGIVVRSFGLSFFVYSLWYLLYGVATALAMEGTYPKWRIAYFVSGGLFLLVSLYFLKGAKHLVKFCYSKES